MPKEQMITCPKCHGRGTYKVPLFDEENGDGYYNTKMEWFRCRLCHGTGKITLEFYEEIQRKCRGEDK